MLESSDNITMMGDFNCKEICWIKQYTGGGQKSWDGILMDLVMNDIMTRWIKELEIIKEINYQCPLGKSDYVLIQFEVNNSIREKRREECKNERYNDGKADFEG